MSASTIQFTFLLLIRAVNASSAFCCLCPGWNPCEKLEKLLFLVIKIRDLRKQLEDVIARASAVKPVVDAGRKLTMALTEVE